MPWMAIVVPKWEPAVTGEEIGEQSYRGSRVPFLKTSFPQFRISKHALLIHRFFRACGRGECERSTLWCGCYCGYDLRRENILRTQMMKSLISGAEYRSRLRF